MGFYFNMKIMNNNNNNNINFKGYKNAIYNKVDDDQYKLRFMSMELNNDGCKDLTEFKEMQKLCGRSENGDILHCIYAKLPDSNGALFLDGYTLFNGIELKKLYEQYSDLDGYKDVYKQEEKAALKAYTLLASITRRMMENSLCTMDGGMGKVIQSAMEAYSPLFSDKNSTFDFLHTSLLKPSPLEHVAEFFNNYVAKNMKQFFK